MVATADCRSTESVPWRSSASSDILHIAMSLPEGGRTMTSCRKSPLPSDGGRGSYHAWETHHDRAWCTGGESDTTSVPIPVSSRQWGACISTYRHHLGSRYLDACTHGIHMIYHFYHHLHHNIWLIHMMLYGTISMIWIYCRTTVIAWVHCQCVIKHVMLLTLIVRVSSSSNSHLIRSGQTEEQRSMMLTPYNYCMTWLYSTTMIIITRAMRTLLKESYCYVYIPMMTLSSNSDFDWYHVWLLLHNNLRFIASSTHSLYATWTL
jgi:hypothetical protein